MSTTWKPIALLALALAACMGGGSVVMPDDDGSTARRDVSLDQQFAMQVRDTVRVQGAGKLLYFQRVPEDSRCPSDVLCPWAGDALVVLEVLSEDGATPSEIVTLHTTLEPRTATVDGITIRLVYLNPYPTSRGQIDPWSYVATILVTD